MRTGACTLQQALTAEAATVLKLSLALARRRGHAQVTPLHVATTLLSSTATSSSLLRRACVKSQPRHPASHPLQCRALDLCFNVALNRLPASPCSASLHPSLSNALIAALKRAQAHQRRGCVEIQQHQNLHQQPSPLLAIKVELEQLIISILDDPSVSRVMREAGFSSTCVKNNLEEETSASASSLAHNDIINPFFKLSSWQAPPRSSSQKEDLSAVMEVMLRKQGRRSNAVVVGDSVTITDGLVADLMVKVERGDVPDDIKDAQFVKLHLSHVHLRLMGKSDVDTKVSHLRKKITALAADKGGRGVIIHAGDLRWAVDDEEARDGCGFKPVDYMAEELGRLLSPLRSSNGKVWLLATASYQTYVRCQTRQPSLETLWGLQAVVVPSGGLTLSLRATSDGLEPPRLTKLFDHPLQFLGSKNYSSMDDEKLSCCSECTSKFEKEASVFEFEKNEPHHGSTQLPLWLQKLRPDDHKDSLSELRSKWNSLCRNLHRSRQNQLYLPFLNGIAFANNSNLCSSYSSWSNSKQSKHSRQPHFSSSSSEATAKHDPMFGICNWLGRDETKQRFSEVGLNSLKTPRNEDVNITLSLGSGALLADSATSSKDDVSADQEEGLSSKLQENMPWQSEIIPSIVESLTDTSSCQNKSLCILLEGSDRISKRRLAQVILEHFGGSKVEINSRKWANVEALEKGAKVVILIEEIERADSSFTRYLTDVLKMEGQGVIVIMTTSNYGDQDAGSKNAIKMMLQVEEIKPIDKDLKRKPETTLQSSPKRRASYGPDLNLLAEEERRKLNEEDDNKDEEAAPSDLTNETSCCATPNLPPELLQLVTARFSLEERSDLVTKSLLLKLQRAFEEEAGGGGIGRLVVDESAAGELTAAAGFFSERCFERWAARVVLGAYRETVGNGGGGKVRLCAEGKLGNVEEFGFMGSVLPGKIDMPREV
ncbi:protein SMAX1-LIKE 4-like [Zingiber officinale]|uniref:Clp R domain-containing protein n=1 Tax=Zingiber officinale TaxID=94328 RepID=A0A8J5H4X7_ZINOF|nr:protein SMAX1-LIKE 4-like [Zingiber officinale]KAG6516101.1 hypothetical protein ZIOFF_026549 [Zingiber officinale]